MIDLNTFMARALDLLGAASVSTYVRCVACSDSITVTRALTALGYLEWAGWNTTEYRWRITEAGRAWLEAQHPTPIEQDKPSALDELVYAATGDDPADDPRAWTGVR